MTESVVRLFEVREGNTGETKMADTPEVRSSAGSLRIGQAVAVAAAAVVLSIGVGYLLTHKTNSDTRAELAKFQTQTSTDTAKLSTQIEEDQRIQDGLKKQIAALTDRANKLDEEKTHLVEKITVMTTSFDRVATDFGKFAKGQEVVDKTQNSDIIATNTNVKRLEDRVHYIDEKLKRIDDLERDVLGLKQDSGALRDEFTGLRSDMKTVRSKTDITEKDIVELTERTRVFQLKVLAARAREAADAARKIDLKTLVNRLDDVEDR